MEGEATNRAIQLAKVAGNVPLYIVHMSASEALEEVAEARHKGHNVFAETCPQYLYLSIEDQLAQPGFECAKWVCSTPLRSKHEHHHRDLWKGLRMNELAVVSTDHSAWEGFEVDGKVDTVLSRGTVLIQDDQYVGQKGHGKFVKRGLSQYLT